MAQIKPIVIGVSPNQVTFNPVAAQRQNTDAAVLVAKDASYPLGSKTLLVMVRYPSGNQKTERVKMKLQLPKVQTSLDSTTLAYPTPYAEIEFVFDQSVPVADRTELRTRMLQLLAAADVVDAVDNGSPLI